MLRKFCCILFLVFLSLGALAQRQTADRVSLEGYGSFGRGFRLAPRRYVFAPVGGGAAVSFYNFTGRFVAGIDYHSTPLTFLRSADAVLDSDPGVPGESYLLDEALVSVSVGYLHRIWGTHSRDFTVSAGGCLSAGVSVCHAMENYHHPEDGSTYAQTGFCLGVVPEAQAEYFFGRNISVYGSFSLRMPVVDTVLNGCLDSDWLQPTGHLGLKYYF